MCAGALIASQGLITATLVREGHYIQMPLCLSIDRQMLDSVCKCFSAPYPTPPQGKYVTLNWLKHDCAMIVPGWIPLLVVANVTCIVLCCISGPTAPQASPPPAPRSSLLMTFTTSSDLFSFLPYLFSLWWPTIALKLCIFGQSTEKKKEETMQSSQKQNYYKFIAFVL